MNLVGSISSAMIWLGAVGITVTVETEFTKLPLTPVLFEHDVGGAALLMMMKSARALKHMDHLSA